MATKSISYGYKSDTGGVLTAKIQLIYKHIDPQLPPFARITSITPSYDQTAQQTYWLGGTNSNTSNSRTYYANGKYALFSNYNAITDSSVLGNRKSIYPSDNIAEFVFTAAAESTSYYVNKHTVYSFSLKYTYEPFPYNISFKVKKQGNIITPTMSDNIFSGTLNEDETSATVTVNTEAYPGYRFIGWEDQNGEVIEPTRTLRVDLDCDYIAVFEPVPYVVNYYDMTSGTLTLIDSKNCTYDTTYVHPDLPINTISKTGYLTNPSGWLTTSTETYVRYNTTEVRDKEGHNIILQHSGSFSNLTTTPNDVINFYFKYCPIQYEITYVKYIEGTANNYVQTIDYRNYGEGDFFLANLPSATPGYKLTNQMLEIDGPIDSSITSSWFESSDHMNPGDPKTNYIDSEYLDNVRVYSFETPINYSINFITMLEGNIENSEIVETVYDKAVVYDYTPIELTGYVCKGWYETLEDVSSWYIDQNNEFINGKTELGFKFNRSKLTTEDQKQIEFYCYYVPKSYSVEYQWLDEYEGTTPPPEKQIRIYNKENTIVQAIPILDYFDIENAGTINWYYYENNDTTTERLINTKTEIASTDTINYVFYAVRYPTGSNIGFSSNDEDFGSVIIINQKEDNMYEEGDIVKVYVSPTDIAYFSHWSDGDNQPYREITAEEVHKHYEAVFRSNQVMGVRQILLGDNTPVKAIYKGTDPVYKE